jgi:hypothetical protein
VTELASTLTPCEIASQAAHAIAVLNELTHEAGRDADDSVTEAIEALAAAGQAADMMTAAFTEARAATQSLTPARHRGWESRPAN